MAKHMTIAAPHMHADYDQEGDVLYLTLGIPGPGFGDVGYDDIIFRFSDVEERPIGATIVGYRAAQWPKRKNELAEAVGDHLHVGPQEVLSALAEIGL